MVVNFYIIVFEYVDEMTTYYKTSYPKSLTAKEICFDMVMLVADYRGRLFENIKHKSQSFHLDIFIVSFEGQVD